MHLIDMLRRAAGFNYDHDNYRETPTEPRALIAGAIDPCSGAQVIRRDDLTVHGVMPLRFCIDYRGDRPTAAEDPLAPPSPLGRRWRHNYMMRIVCAGALRYVIADENPTERLEGCFRERFRLPAGDGDVSEADGNIDASHRTSPVPAGRLIPLDTLPGSSLTLDATSGRYTLRHGGAATYLFDSDGLLATIADRHGNTQQLGYDRQRRLISITDTGSGRMLALAYRGDRLHTVTDPLQRRVVYAQDRRGDLLSVTDPCGSRTRYAYGGNALMRSAVDGRGNTMFGNVYSGGRVVRRLDARAYCPDPAEPVESGTAGGNATTIVYQRRMLNAVPAMLASGLDAGGNAYSTTMARAADGGVCVTRLQVTSPGHINSLLEIRDAGRRLTARTRYHGPLADYRPGSGNIVTCTYDARGNRLTEVTAVSRRRIHAISRTYDDAGNMLTQSVYEGAATGWKPGMGNTWTYLYNADHTLRSVHSPLGLLRRMHYDKHGLPRAMVDFLGNITRYTYVRGSLAVTGNAVGEQMTIDADAIGRPVVVTFSRPGAADITVHTVFDANSRVCSTRSTRSTRGNSDSDALATGMVYDANGNLLAMRNAAGCLLYRIDAANRPCRIRYKKKGGIDPARDLHLGYDALNFLSSVTMAGSTLRTAFDAAGALQRETGADGRVWRYTDRMLPTGGNGPCLRRCDSTVPDNRGSDRSSRSNNGHSGNGERGGASAIVYDPLGRPVSITAADGGTVAIVYTQRLDPVSGTWQSVATATHPGIDGRPATSRTLVHDALGRIVLRTDRQGRATTYAYGVCRDVGPLGSHVLSVTIAGPDGAQRTLRYDQCGRLCGDSGASPAAKTGGPGLALAPDNRGDNVAPYSGAYNDGEMAISPTTLVASSACNATQAANARLFAWLAAG